MDQNPPQTLSKLRGFIYMAVHDLQPFSAEMFLMCNNSSSINPLQHKRGMC